MPFKLERYAYFPVYCYKTKKTHFEKLKVVKVWISPDSSKTWFGKEYNYTLWYVLENCCRVAEAMLITDIKGLDPYKQFMQYRNSRLVRQHQTIFAPHAERYDMDKDGDIVKFRENLKAESDKWIKWHIDNDVIFGEFNVTETINDLNDKE